jgi:adenine/guanine phosphoribosyltransferase-like PRPP-binding protein
VSGALIAPAIAHKMGKGLIVVRKKGDDTHSARKIEGHFDQCRYVIVDDFICTGKTLKFIAQSIAANGGVESDLVGIYQYAPQGGSVRGRLHTPLRPNLLKETTDSKMVIKNLFEKYSE